MVLIRIRYQSLPNFPWRDVMGAIQIRAILELKPGTTVAGCDGASDSALFGEEYFP